MADRILHPNPKQKLALELPTKRLILAGGIRAGKSLTACIKIRDIAVNMPGSQIMVMKSTLKEIRDDVFKILYNSSDGLLANTRMFGRLNKSNYEHYLPNGSKIIFRQGSEAGDEKKLRGLDLSAIFFFQAENIAKPVFEDALGRLTHWGDYKDPKSRGYAYVQKYGSGEYPGKARRPAHFFIMDCNPDTGSWIYDEIIARCPESVDPVKFAATPHIRYQFIDDKTKSPAYWDIINFKSHDNSQLPDVVEWIAEQKAMTSDVYYRRMIEGEWVGSEGMVFNHFENTIHIAPNSSCPEFEYNKLIHEIVVAIDAGNSWYTGVVFTAFDKKTNKYIIFDEIKIKNTIISDIAELIKDKLISYRIPIDAVKFVIDAAANATESNGISRSDQYKQAKIYVTNANKTMGLERINGLFKQKKIYIMGNCIHLLRDIKSYAFDKDGKPKKGTGEKAFDVMDAFRYCINNFAYGSEIVLPTPAEILASSEGTPASKLLTYQLNEHYFKPKSTGFGI